MVPGNTRPASEDHTETHCLRRTKQGVLWYLGDAGQMARYRLRYQALRLRFITAYEGKCECCGEDNQRLLTIDHMGGGGRDTGHSAYAKAIKAGHSSGKYRLLCWNCNMAIGNFGYCPHDGQRKKSPANWTTENRWQLRVERVTAYGGKCRICGESRIEFLCIDHINGGGSQHRRSFNNNNDKFYRWLESQGYPRDEYQLLCSNCNALKEMYVRESQSASR